MTDIGETTSAQQVPVPHGGVFTSGVNIGSLACGSLTFWASQVCAVWPVVLVVFGTTSHMGPCTWFNNNIEHHKCVTWAEVSSCKGLHNSNTMLNLWLVVGTAVYGCGQFEIKNNELLAADSGHRGGMLGTHEAMLKTYLQRNRNPDMTFNLSDTDRPKQGCVGFCSFSAVGPLMPHPEYWSFWHRSSPVSMPFFLKRNAAVWRGAYNDGVQFGRTAIIQAALRFKDRMDVGYRCDQIDNRGPVDSVHRQYCAENLQASLPEWRQFALYRFVLNIPGNCGSVRLARQLRANVVTLIVVTNHRLSFTASLVPFKHYIPVRIAIRRKGTRCHDGSCIPWMTYSTNLSATFRWIDSHPRHVDQIRIESTRFADKYLSTEAIDATIAATLQSIAAPV
jgi:hypothetical protein